MTPRISTDHLNRGAVVYVRQSTMAQVLGNTESRRRQYALVEHAQAAGFASVTVTAYDADGTVLGQDGLDLTGEYRAWLPVPAEVPAGGSVVVTVVDAAGAATDATVTLGGQLVG